MSLYEYLEQQRNNCLLMARIHADDPKLKQFYINAARGFKLKQSKLTLEEARK